MSEFIIGDFLYTPNAKESQACRDFAYNFKGYDNWASRKQIDPEKMKRDNFVGKMGEVAVFRIFRKMYGKVTPPDLQIYDNSNKSYKQDMFIEDVQKIHIKTQDEVQSKQRKRGLSWIGQWADVNGSRVGHDNHLFSASNDWLVGCQLIGETVSIKAIVSIDIIVENNLFEEPEINKYNSIKKAVYFDSLVKAKGIFDGNLQISGRKV